MKIKMKYNKTPRRKLFVPSYTKLSNGKASGQGSRFFRPNPSPYANNKYGNNVGYSPKNALRARTNYDLSNATSWNQLRVSSRNFGGRAKTPRKIDPMKAYKARLWNTQQQMNQQYYDAEAKGPRLQYYKYYTNNETKKSNYN
jgi:hypothetical protein